MKAYFYTRLRVLLWVAAALLLVMPAVSSPAFAAKPDMKVLREKAGRFYAHSEWPNALAMFYAILEDEPDDIATYARAIVVSGIIQDTERQMSLFERAQNAGLSLDRLFDEVRKSAFEIGEPQEAERFFYRVKDHLPWMSRNIQIRLAKYYDIRNNGAKMVAMSDTLLALNARDPMILGIKARGYKLLDDYPSAVKCYKEILKIDPTDVDALLNIWVYYYYQVKSRNLPISSEEVKEARLHLAEANRLQPSAYIERLLSELR